MLDVFHICGMPSMVAYVRCNFRLALFLKPLSSLGVKVSALPMTGMTLTRGKGDASARCPFPQTEDERMECVKLQQLSRQASHLRVTSRRNEV